jgi:uncharacterized protein YkwD
MGRLAAYAFMVLLAMAFFLLLPALTSILPQPPAQPAGTAPHPSQNQTPPAPVAVNRTLPVAPPVNPPTQRNATLGTTLADAPNYSLSLMELNIHALINQERARAGLRPLSYNDGIAGVARDHSIDLAKENEPLTEPDLFCHRLFIHHEGFDFGLYELDRLHNRSIYYFSSAGENIYMSSAWDYIETMAAGSFPPCPEEGTSVAPEYAGSNASAQVKADLQERLDYVKTARRVNWTYVEWMSQDSLERSIVQGWMDSPGHRKNILDPDFSEEGIGVAKVNDFVIVTEDFIERVDCGYLGAGCCRTDVIFCYEPWQCDDGGVCVS